MTSYRDAGVDIDAVTDKAMQRGKGQCGTLGSGNHFLEIQVVEEVVDEQAARAMGLEEGGIAVMIHSGSRGLGYQVCDDALRNLRGVPARYGIQLPDRQLACAPVESPEGQEYLGAMRAAANYAWANRQLLMWQTREIMAEFFGRGDAMIAVKGVVFLFDLVELDRRQRLARLSGRRPRGTCILIAQETTSLLNVASRALAACGSPPLEPRARVTGRQPYKSTCAYRRAFATNLRKNKAAVMAPAKGPSETLFMSATSLSSFGL